MRQTKYLIQEAKENTNTTDVEAISDALCVRLLNRAQDFIMAYLYNKSIKTKIFRETFELEVVSYQDTYDLPDDIYAVNSLSSVQLVVGAQSNIIYCPVKQISEKDRGIKTGYFVAKSQIIFSPIPFVSMNVLLSYTKKNPSIGISYGTVASVTSTQITLAVGYQDMTGTADYFSVVDFNGKILVKGLLIDQTAGVLTVSSTTGVTVGSYVVPGAYASTHCFLPDELETPMITWLEKLIQVRLSSSDEQLADIISKDQLEEIASMFADNSGDSFMPPILEYTEWA